jgi:hypothetical protein
MCLGMVQTADFLGFNLFQRQHKGMGCGYHKRKCSTSATYERRIMGCLQTNLATLVKVHPKSLGTVESGHPCRHCALQF